MQSCGEQLPGNELISVSNTEEVSVKSFKVETFTNSVSREVVYEKGIEDQPEWPRTTCVNFFGDSLNCFVRIYDTILPTNIPDKSVKMRIWESKADGWMSCYRYWVDYKGDSIHLLSNQEWCGISEFYWLTETTLVFDGLHHYYYRDSSLTGYGEEVGSLYLMDMEKRTMVRTELNSCYSKTPFGIYHKQGSLYYFPGDNSGFDFVKWIKLQCPEANPKNLKQVEEWIHHKFKRG